MAIDTQTTLSAAMMVGLVGLNGKIVYDWLKVRKNGNGNGVPAECSKKHAEIDSHIAVTEGRLNNIDARLQKGDEKMSTIHGELSDMSGDIKVLLDRSMRRREGDERS